MQIKKISNRARLSERLIRTVDNMKGKFAHNDERFVQINKGWK